MEDYDSHLPAPPKKALGGASTPSADGLFSAPEGRGTKPIMIKSISKCCSCNRHPKIHLMLSRNQVELLHPSIDIVDIFAIKNSVLLKHNQN